MTPGAGGAPGFGWGFPQAPAPTGDAGAAPEASPESTDGTLARRQVSKTLVLNPIPFLGHQTDVS